MTEFSFGKLPPWVIALLVVLCLIAGAGELFVTGLLIEHVPWLGWSITGLSVASVIFAVIYRLKQAADRPRPGNAGPPPEESGDGQGVPNR